MELGHATASATNARVFQRAYGDPATALAGALLLHGLGEHSQRHEGHLELLAAQGIYSRTFDWPGHGRTAGQRGHLGPMSTITCLIQEQMDALRSDMGTNKQVGLLGHSMGGFLTLYHLARYPNLADFSWVSSTLIDPTANASWLKQKLVRALNHLSPRIPIKSGIRTRDCRVGAARRRDAGTAHARRRGARLAHEKQWRKCWGHADAQNAAQKNRARR